MARQSTFSTVFLMVVAAAALIQGTAAAVYIVGDATGWTIPSTATFYSNWAASHTFAVGDILVFNFPSGAHDVAKVTKTAYDSCSSASPLSLQTNPPVNVTLSSSGENYFLCTIGQHCASGQKLAVNVAAAAGSPTPTPSPSPAPTTPPSPTPTPSPSSPTPSTTPAPTPAPTPSPPTSSPAPAPSSSTSPPSPPSPPPPASLSPPPSESTSPPPPPPPTGSAPKAIAAFGVVVMSIAMGALF